MTTSPQTSPDPAPTPTEQADGVSEVIQPEQDTKKVLFRRRRMLILLGIILLLTAFFACLLVRYITRPVPLPELLPVGVDYPPHYLYSVSGINSPMGVALSPDGTKLYVTEVDGDRQVKVLAADGSKLIREFAPPTSSAGERAPVYLAVDSQGRVYVTDRLQHAIFMYTGDGDYLDTILDRNTTLSGYVLTQAGSLPQGSIYYFNLFMSGVQYKLSGESDWQVAPPPTKSTWSPLGVSIAPDSRLLVTDLGSQDSQVLVYPSGLTSATARFVLPLEPDAFGAAGNGNGQMSFPNDTVVDSKGRFFVSDSNNGRITVWDASRNYLFFFGAGTGTGGLGLPHGLFMDSKDRLFVADTTSHDIKVYNVAGDRPVFLYAFGQQGQGDGQFSYPNDVVMSNDGKLYIADRANNRVQVWSY